MSSPSQPKRRRLNNVSALSKPFVSPVRRDVSAATNASERDPLKSLPDASNHTVGHYKLSTLSHTTCSHSPVTATSVKTSSPGRFTINTSARASLLSSKRPRPTPEEQATQKAITALQCELKNLRSELDALGQFIRLSTSSKVPDLDDLRLRWMVASQEAAEEVFGGIKERVMRMGGVSAWKASERKKSDRSHGSGEFGGSRGFDEPEDNDADCEFDADGNELPEAEQTWRKAQKAKLKQEREDAAEPPDELEQDVEPGGDGKKEVWREDSADDDAFTMDMMLRYLNIDLEVIGWNRGTQCWVTDSET